MPSNREVVVRERRRLTLPLNQHCDKDVGRHLAREQAATLLGVAKTCKTSEQEVEVARAWMRSKRRLDEITSGGRLDEAVHVPGPPPRSPLLGHVAAGRGPHPGDPSDRRMLSGG